MSHFCLNFFSCFKSKLKNNFSVCFALFRYVSLCFVSTFSHRFSSPFQFLFHTLIITYKRMGRGGMSGGDNQFSAALTQHSLNTHATLMQHSNNTHTTLTLHSHNIHATLMKNHVTLTHLLHNNHTTLTQHSHNTQTILTQHSHNTHPPLTQ